MEEDRRHKQFTAQVIIDGLPKEIGYGPSKKKAEQDAARKTLENLRKTSDFQLFRAVCNSEQNSFVEYFSSAHFEYVNNNIYLHSV